MGRNRRANRRKREIARHTESSNRNEEQSRNEEEQIRNMKSYHLALEIFQQYKALEKTKASGSHEDGTNPNPSLNFSCKHKTHCKMCYITLEELATKEPLEILLSLNFPCNGFMELISADSIGNNTMEKIITVLAEATKAREMKNLSSFIDGVVSGSPFIKLHLHQYLLSLQKSDIVEVHKSGVIPNTILFLSKLEDTATAAFPLILRVLNDTIYKLCKRGLILTPSIKDKIQDLQKKQEFAIQQFRHKISSHKTCNPPENFRTISILPTKEDFTNMHPFLRPNIVEGSYLDSGHYLDVQFRLLREDYIRPLRETIQKYRSTLGASKKNLKNVRIFKNVHILYPYNTEHRIVVHLISFDVKPFAHINWEASKLLLPGSLLCLSSDSFETMKIATVSKRNTSEIKKGKLEIHFEELDEEIFSISPSTTFVMVESDAYFEAFRHTLQSLQLMKNNEFPLKQYIVNVQKEVKTPKYLNQDIAYNFSSTFRGISQRYDEVPVLYTKYWPLKEELRLNHSQYAVLKAALTKEFVIIQGPPGTGKTFIGLKITQMLIENSRLWNTNGRSTPILLVCYTNHALDQFLEGILKFTKDVVRVGGRCTNDKVKEFKLCELRQKARENRSIPKHIYLQKRDIFEQVEDIEDHLQSYYWDIKNSTQQVLSVEILQSFMKNKHINSLQEGPFNNRIQSKRYTLADWLNIPQPSQMENMESSDEEEEQIRSVDDITTIFDDDDDDIDFEIGLREGDEDEYEHVNKKKHSAVHMMNGRRTSINQGQFTVNTLPLNHKIKRYLREQLKCQETMKISEEERIGNVWTLAIGKRWSLYCLWIARYVANLLQYTFALQKRYKELSEKLKELHIAADICILRKAKVIGMTTTGASKYREFLQDLQPRIVIVEEAAEVLEAHIVTSLAENTQHLILIGDHQQLKPSPTVYELGKQYDFDISLFERMIKNKMTHYQLTVQHRMRPCIVKLLTPHIYATLENDPSVEAYENILGMKTNMFFVNHYEYERNISDTKSHSNLHEATFLVKLCKYLRCQGYNASQLTVLATYNGQLAVLNRLMKQEKIFEGVHVTVVDNYQGEENDIVLISFVRSNEEGNIGFLKVSNRVCVALSRAKKGLYCIGNFELLADRSQLWRNITSELKRQNAIGPSLPLCCQNHPETVIKVFKANDFVKHVPEGVCSKPCSLKMKCCHKCPRSCHLDDVFHTQIKCLKPCSVALCSLGHKCPKICYEECGKCKFPVQWICSKCNNKYNQIPCHLKLNNLVQCVKLCQKILPCGHVCSKHCYEQCSPCSKIIIKRFECTHSITVPCVEASKYTVCEIPCEKIFKCGHMCTNICGMKPCPPCKIGTCIFRNMKNRISETTSKCNIM